MTSAMPSGAHLAPRCLFVALPFLAGHAASYAAPITPWADTALSYDAGSNAAPGFTDPASALGEPSRVTVSGSFTSVATPFSGAFGQDQLVAIGEGGHLTVAFDEPVTNDTANPFGVDLLVFGNAFHGSGGGGTAGGLFAEGGDIEVSADGLSWVSVPGVVADGPFATLGYLDITEPFPSAPGAVLSDFTRPVDPSFDPVGKTLAQIIAGYNGSGGGVGIDLGAFGLSEISFVRISNPVGSGVTPEIDGFADVRAVPGPASLALVSAGLLIHRRRRRA